MSTLLAENIEEFFNRNYTRAVNVNELAESLNFRKRHTEWIMQRLFGMSFGEMLNKKRLITAKLLLRTTDVSVIRIGDRSGARVSGSELLLSEVFRGVRYAVGKVQGMTATALL